ncbi:MAG TPA: hypothetical protein ENJ82_10135 [Bacteroidetes bacterium]|nr:hypothetical protein [Bacteroidota bacterium]
MDKNHITETANLLAKNWGLTTTSPSSMDELRAALRGRILELLEDNFAGLVNAMYRLDISEPLFNNALQAGKTELVADKLVDIVFKRELQRLATRRQYRDQSE